MDDQKIIKNNDNTEVMDFNNFKSKLKEYEPQDGFFDVPIDITGKIPDWMKALKNFDPTGVSGFIIDVLENNKQGREKESIKIALYKLYQSLFYLKDNLDQISNDVAEIKISYLLEDYFEYSRKSSDKIDYFRNILINGVIDEKLSIDEIKSVNKIVSELSYLQLNIIKIYYEKQGEYDYLFLRGNSIIFKFDYLKDKLTNDSITIEEIMRAVIDLSNRGFLNDWGIGRLDYNGPEYFIITDYAKFIIKLTKDYIFAIK